MKSECLRTGSMSAWLLAAAAPAAVTPGIDMQVHVASSPWVTDSPSWNAWVDNCIFALRNGLSNYGGSFEESPTAYQRSGDSAWIGDQIHSPTFTSWRGAASPSGAFAGELGNAMPFGLSAVGTGGLQFSLSQLTGNMNFEGTEWVASLDHVFEFFNSTYSANRVGVLVGADGLLNTSDDIVINSGAATQMVDAFYYAGASWAWRADDLPELAWLAGRGGYNQTMDYTFATASGNFSGSDAVSIVPAPGALALLGLAGLARRRRR